jgi:hypothetical protein
MNGQNVDHRYSTGKKERNLIVNKSFRTHDITNMHEKILWIFE